MAKLLLPQLLEHDRGRGSFHLGQRRQFQIEKSLRLERLQVETFGGDHQFCKRVFLAEVGGT